MTQQIAKIDREALAELKFIPNIEAAAEYDDSDMAAYLDGYQDAMNHEFDIMRSKTDNAYFAGFRKAVQDEQMMVELGWLVETNGKSAHARYIKQLEAEGPELDMEPARMPWERPL